LFRLTIEATLVLDTGPEDRPREIALVLLVPLLPKRLKGILLEVAFLVIVLGVASVLGAFDVGDVNCCLAHDDPAVRIVSKFNKQASY